MIFEGDFGRDGAVCVRQAFSADEVALAARAIEANLAALSPLAKRASADQDGAFIEDFCNWERIEPLERFIRESPAAAIAAQLTGPGHRRVMSIRFLGDDMVHAPRTWRTSPPFPGLEAELPAGAPLDHRLFPILWSSEGA